MNGDIPERERLVWEDDELRASLFRGLADAAEGKGRPLSWVTADEDNEALVETVNILSDDEAMSAIREGEADLEAGA